MADLTETEHLDLIDAKLINDRLDKAIKDCGGNDYLGDNIQESKMEEIKRRNT